MKKYFCFFKKSSFLATYGADNPAYPNDSLAYKGRHGHDIRADKRCYRHNCCGDSHSHPRQQRYSTIMNDFAMKPAEARLLYGKWLFSLTPRRSVSDNYLRNCDLLKSMQ